MPKFMQSLGAETYQRLLTEAKVRDVTIQSLIRTVIVPDWLKSSPTTRAGIETPTEARDNVHPTTLLSQTGILAETRKPLLRTTIGRARP